MKNWFLIIALIVGSYATGLAQDYHAAFGSNYTTSLGLTNNPGSILSSPYKWDLTLFGTQLTTTSNIYTIHDYSLLSNPANAAWSLDSGLFARKGDLSFNTNLFNARISLSRTKAIAFGINARGSARLRTSAFNYVDTLNDINNFFQLNQGVRNYETNFISSSWIELFGSYAQTVIDNDKERLNAGVTLKLSRGISGGYARLQNVNVSATTQAGQPVFQLLSGSLDYRYSSNYDPWMRDSTQTAMNFLKTSQGGLALDLGVEYLVKTQAVSTFYDDDDYYEYDWKIGVSLLDVGFNRYRSGLYSFSGTNPRPGLTNLDLDQKFGNIGSFPEFRDSLRTILATRGQKPIFTVLNPMRLVINVDRYIHKNFYLNAETSVGLSSIVGSDHLYVRPLSFLTVTPRWETKSFGAYLPVQYNSVGKFWVGVAIKAGPVLLGTHNLANLFAKNKVQNGGGYLSIILHARKDNEARRDKRLDCPR